MKKITAERLQEILIASKQWANGEGGQRAYLQDADLQRAYLQDADLQGADLRGAYLQGADLRDADLRDADFRGADLRGAYLQDADLQGAYLQDADLRGAYLQGADLRGAYLQGAEGKKIIITRAPVQISNLRWFVTIWDAHMQIGCEFHSHHDWSEFDDDRIKRMDKDAIAFWKKYKDVLMQLCAIHGEKS